MTDILSIQEIIHDIYDVLGLVCLSYWTTIVECSYGRYIKL